MATLSSKVSVFGLFLSFLGTFVFLRSQSTSQADTRGVKSFGAAGDGVTDDTAAINTAIAALQPGDELFFPCGTYKISSGLTIRESNVTVAGAPGCATIQATGSGFVAMTVTGGGLSGSTSLTADSPELSTTFTANLLPIGGLAAGDYVLLQEGGRDFSTDVSPGDDRGCDVSGCRGEVLQVLSVNGNTATVATAMHFPYNVALNAASVSKIVNPVTGVTVRDLTFDGSGTVGEGLYLRAIVNSVVSNVTVQHFVGEGAFSYWGYNLAWDNITITSSGNYNYGSGNIFSLIDQGNASVNGMFLSSYPASNAFGWGLHTGANGTYTNVTVDKAGSGIGRPCKIHASSYNTFNGLTCKNGTGNYNGLILDYYSSHNTLNNCMITNNSGNGIVGFGNYNQYNTFNNCTVSGNTVFQMFAGGDSALGNRDDHYWTVNGGVYISQGNSYAIQFYNSNNVSVHDTQFAGPGVHGLDVQANDACVNRNTFSNFTTDIVLNGINNLGSGNTTPDGTIPSLIPGTCVP